MTKFRNKYRPEKAIETDNCEQKAASFSTKENGKIELTPALQQKISTYFSRQEFIDAKEKELQAASYSDRNTIRETIKAHKLQQNALNKTLLKEKELWAEAEKITKRVVILDYLKPRDLQIEMKEGAGFDAKTIQLLHQDLRGKEYSRHQALHEKLSYSHSMGGGQGY